jgi:asparagine synthase (glutamine-hydrolysing)
MSTDDGRVTIVFNGEIYNYVEQREELRAKGYEFKSTGDTEVLLAADLEWGKNCLNRLNGMWAFMIHDARRNIIFGSRDRFGIKPLYCYRNARSLLISSEIKAIRGADSYAGDINWCSSARFLLNNEIGDRAETFFTGVEQIPQGTGFIIDGAGNIDSWKFWSVSGAPQVNVTNPADEFAALFEDSVRLRLRSDVPVGVSLSGGLDSTSIICAMSRQKGNGDVPPTVAFSFNDTEFDESQYIGSTIEQTNARLISVDFDPNLVWKDLDQLLYYHDEPVHSATAFVGFKIMEAAASNGVKVMLNGQGADETLAGYPSYFGNYWHTLLMNGQLGYLRSQLQAYGQEFGGSVAARTFQLLANALKAGLSQMAAYRRLARCRNRNRVDRLGWYSESFCAQLDHGDRGPWQLSLDDALRDSMEKDLLPIYLRVEDRNSMAHSVEARLPFLDYRVVELAFSLPPDWKMRGPLNKYVLRAAMKGRIPDSVRTRIDKFGFPVPIDRWFRETELYELMQDLVTSRGVIDSGVYNVEKLRSALKLHYEGKMNCGSELFDVLQFEVWRKLATG